MIMMMIMIMIQKPNNWRYDA